MRTGFSPLMRVLRIVWAILPARSSVPGEEGTEIGDANAI